MQRISLSTIYSQMTGIQRSTRTRAYIYIYDCILICLYFVNALNAGNACHLTILQIIYSMMFGYRQLIYVQFLMSLTTRCLYMWPFCTNVASRLPISSTRNQNQVWNGQFYWPAFSGRHMCVGSSYWFGSAFCFSSLRKPHGYLWEDIGNRSKKQSWQPSVCRSNKVCVTCCYNMKLSSYATCECGGGR